MPIQKAKTKRRPNESLDPRSPDGGSPTRGRRTPISSGPASVPTPEREKRTRRGGYSVREEEVVETTAVQSPVVQVPGAQIGVNVEMVASPAVRKRGRPKKGEEGLTSGDEVVSPTSGAPRAKRGGGRKKKSEQQAEADAAVAAMEAAVRQDDVTRQMTVATEQVIEEQVVMEEVPEHEVVHQEAETEGDLPVLEPIPTEVQHQDGVTTVVTIDQGDEHVVSTTAGQENILVMLDNGEVTAINPADAAALGLTVAPDGQVYAAEGTKLVTEQELQEQQEQQQQQELQQGIEVEPSYPQDPAMLCPICSDSNSGYHYGIFACESCKGFFKRAIQNNRQLRCNFTGNCDITIATRKRCAACRLRKCLLAGMKVEAIRLDRRRGGRSVYIGPPPLPHFRPQRFIKSSTGLKPYRSDQLLQAETSRLLTDVMNLEPQMAEDGEMEPCCEPLLTEADADPGAALLHLAEHRLYRLIHWARQLPNFSSIETNDQIVLLQNSWANLLALFMCWQSTGSEHLVMNFGKVLSRKSATALGLEDIFDRVEAMSEFFNTIGLEREEYVAMRLLILVNPDVDMLGDPLKVREFQEQFSEMLLFHTITYRAIESLRYTTILLKVQEIAHIGYLLHDWMLSRYDSYDDSSRPQLTGLLVELLKHESVSGAAPGSRLGPVGGEMALAPQEPPTETLVPDDHPHAVRPGAHHVVHVVHSGAAAGIHHVGAEEVDTSEVVDNLEAEVLQEEVVHVDAMSGVVDEEQVVTAPAQVVTVVVDQERGIVVTENNDAA